MHYVIWNSKWRCAHWSPQTAAARNALAAEMPVPTNHHQLLHIVDFFRQQHLSHIDLFICRTTVAFYSMKIHGSTKAVTATQNQQQLYSGVDVFVLWKADRPTFLHIEITHQQWKWQTCSNKPCEQNSISMSCQTNIYDWSLSLFGHGWIRIDLKRTGGRGQMSKC